MGQEFNVQSWECSFYLIQIDPEPIQQELMAGTENLICNNLFVGRILAQKTFIFENIHSQLGKTEYTFRSATVLPQVTF